ncbi:MAG: AAA family ATPase [Proteobacteria bacterium]|nr:AAA family ATPase [Pseudomonadota bacterium]
MFSAEFGYTIEAAIREAVKRRHTFFCIEHLLFAMLFDDQIIEILEGCGGDVDAIRRELERFFEQLKEETTQPQSDTESIDPIQTPGVRRVLHRSITQVLSSGKKMVSAPDVLVGIFSEEDTHAKFALEHQGITKLDILNFVSHGLHKERDTEQFLNALEQDAPYDESQDSDSESRSGPGTSKAERGIIKKFTEDLTAQARAGELDPIIGRDAEIERALKVLARRQKNNPLFLGDPGVGKSAMAAAIAQRLVSGDVPEALKGAELFSLNMGSVVAGTKFRGEFEERLKQIVTELAKRHRAILFIDEIHTLVGAGATGSGSMDAANLLKPALASGKLRCMGSTTHEDYKKSFEKDRALSRRFTVIDLREPSVSETVEVLRGLKGRFEQHHTVQYTQEALEAAADKEIEAVVSAIARVPVKSVSSQDTELLRNLEPNLKQRVFGQDPAVQAIVLAIKRSRANLRPEHRPIGGFLFAGPTGVGKTELAKALAAELGVHFHRFDMTEYMEKHAVSRLIGAPPGYVGYEEGGQLTDLVRKHPHAVLLLDEIEKAHEDIYNILLQVLDDALLTDSHGKKADFRNTIIIMTTNAGSEKAAAIGFGKLQADTNRETAIKKLFKPEFRNRLDEVIYFNPLPAETIRKIVDKFISEMERQLSDRKISFELTPEARDWLAERGFDPLLGARPMVRLIQREIKDKLADEILFGGLKDGGQVKITGSGEALTFSITPRTSGRVGSPSRKTTRRSEPVKG